MLKGFKKVKLDNKKKASKKNEDEEQESYLTNIQIDESFNSKQF